MNATTDLTRLDLRQSVSAQTRARLTALAVPVLPALLLLAFGAVQLSRNPSTWYDEDFTLLAVRTPLPQLLHAVWNASPLVSWLTVAPSFNAPYYVLMHGWATLFGSSVLTLRVAALLASAAAVAVTGLIGRRLAGPAAGLTAGLLAASGPLWAQQAVQARPYGLAELAIALTILALLRRTQDGRGLLPIGAAACAAGLMHWFTLPVLVGLAAWSLGKRTRAGVAEAATIAAASLPAVGLVVLQLTGGGDGTPIAGDIGATLPFHAIADWSAGAWVLSLALLGAGAIGIWRSPWRGLLLSWTVVPLALVTAMELVRPIYFPRYLLFTLLGLAMAAAIGVTSFPRRWSTAAAIGLVAVSIGACVPRLQAEPLERADQVVAYLQANQTAGQSIAAGDGRAAIELEEQVRLSGSRLASSLLLRPAHIAAGGTATVVWVVRSGAGSTLQPSPNDAYLVAGHWRLERTAVFAGVYGDLTVQRWVR